MSSTPVTSSGSPSVSATHHDHHTLGGHDDWNSIQVGPRTYSLKSQRDVALFAREIQNGSIPGLSGHVTVDGHKVTAGGVTYDLEKAGHAAVLAADLRDGKLDGNIVGSVAYLDEVETGSQGLKRDLVVDGRRLRLNSDTDVRAFVADLKDGKLRGLRAGGLEYAGDKLIQAGGKRYDLSKVDGRQAMMLDLLDGTLDGATAVDPNALGSGVGNASGASAAATSFATDANGYPTLSPDDADYAKAWTEWLKTHSWEQFEHARLSGAIPDEEKLFGSGSFASAAKAKGDLNARFFEMLSFLRQVEDRAFRTLWRA